MSYTDSVELAAKFVWAAFVEGELRALKWIPDDSQGIYESGIEYAMYAVKNRCVLSLLLVDHTNLSGAWSTRFGDVPADAVTKFYEQVADSVFNPSFTTDGDTSQRPSDFLWIVDVDGQIHFAPDVSTAVALYPGCSVALAQTIVPGDPATVDAAQAYQNTALVSAGRFYVLASDRVGRWIGVEDDGGLAITVGLGVDPTDHRPLTWPRHSFSHHSAAPVRKKRSFSSTTKQ
jgi:hypothetical protein